VLCDGRAEDEAAALDGDDVRDSHTAKRLGECFGRFRECRGIREQRRDVLEDDPGFG
jgi:hypothetical protein